MGVCSNCGAQLPEGSTFCQACGTAVPVNSGATNNQQAYTTAQPAYSTEESQIVVKAKAFFDKSKLITLGVAVVVLIVFSILVNAFATTGKNAMGGHASVAKKYVKALSKKDSSALLKLVDDDFLDECDIEKEDIKESVRDNQYKGVKKIKVVGASKMSKDQLDDLEDRYDDRFDYDVKLKGGYTVYFTYVDDDELNMGSVRVVKVGSKWYIEPTDFRSRFYY